MLRKLIIGKERNATTAGIEPKKSSSRNKKRLSSIFRSKKKKNNDKSKSKESTKNTTTSPDEFPSIEPVLTLTLSEDEELDSNFNDIQSLEESIEYHDQSFVVGGVGNAAESTNHDELEEEHIGDISIVYDDNDIVPDKAEDIITTSTNDVISTESLTVKIEEEAQVNIDNNKNSSSSSSTVPSPKPKISPKAAKISTFIFTAQELMTNELNHMREISSKQEEIDKMQIVMEELRATLVKTEHQLNETRDELFETNQELKETHDELCDTKIELDDTKDELFDAKDELDYKNKQLNLLGSTLIQCQDELHSVKEQSQSSSTSHLKSIFQWN